jgi:hypothetical protein
VTWLRRWWGRRHVDTSAEARAALAECLRRTPEVNRLAAEVQAARGRNHFSPMVQNAITRAREA